TANNATTVLTSILRHAADMGVIDSAPRKVGLHKVTQQAFDFLEFEELEALVAAAERDPEPMWLAGVLLGAEAGMRQGEIRALGWEQWSRPTNRITINRALWENELGLPKHDVIRKVPLTRR